MRKTVIKPEEALSKTFQHTLRLDRAPAVSVPLRTGVPFPAGCFDSGQRELELTAPDGAIECQFRPVMHWPDGSVQWALVDWMAAPNVDNYEISLRDLMDKQTFGDVVRVEISDDLLMADELVAKLDLRLADGRRLVARETSREVIDMGPNRNSIRFSGALADETSEEVLHFFWHVHTFSNSPMQYWSLTLRNFQAAQHPGGIWELGDPNSVLIRSASLAFSRSGYDATETSGLARNTVEEAWKNFENHWSVSQCGSGGENYRSKIHRNATGAVEIPRRGYRCEVDGELEEGQRSDPSVILRSNGIGFFSERFWQNFPHALSVDNGHIRFELLPPDDAYHHELQPGEQKTYEFWLANGEVQAVKESLDQVRALPRIHLDPKKVCESGVIPHLVPKSEDANQVYLELVGNAVEGDDTFIAKRERIDMYGWRNFGDVYGDHEAVYSSPEDPLVSQYNNQYDLVFGLGIQTLRGSDSRYRELMQDLARHVIDIDIYHTTQDKPAYNNGQFWHTVHYIDAGLSTHRTYPKGSCGGGPSSGQAYSRGLLLHYCLTGDETAKEAVANMGDWMVAAEDGSKTKFRWLAGGETGLTSASGSDSYHGPGRGSANCLEILVTAFQLSQDRKYLSQAERIIRRVVHPNQDLDALDLLDAERRWFYNMFLQALGRYLDVKLSCNELDEAYSYGQTVLLRFADWMAKHEYPYLDKPEILEYPNETWSGQEMRKCEVFQWASKHADSKRREAYLERAQYFFDVACQQLSESPRRALCRPVALLMSNGYSRSWFQERREALDTMPKGDASDFGSPVVFKSQKQRAIRRAKSIVVATGLTIASLAIVLLAKALTT